MVQTRIIRRFHCGSTGGGSFRGYFWFGMRVSSSGWGCRVYDSGALHPGSSKPKAFGLYWPILGVQDLEFDGLGFRGSGFN